MQPKSISPPAWQSECLAPTCPPVSSAARRRGSTWGFSFKILLGFQLEIKRSCFPAKLSLLPFPVQETSYSTTRSMLLPSIISCSPSPGTGSDWPSTESQGPKQHPPREAPSITVLSKHIRNCTIKPVYHFPSGSFILFKEERQGCRSVCSISHFLCDGVPCERKRHCSVASRWFESSGRTRRGEAECLWIPVPSLKKQEKSTFVCLAIRLLQRT